MLSTCRYLANAVMHSSIGPSTAAIIGQRSDSVTASSASSLPSTSATSLATTRRIEFAAVHDSEARWSGRAGVSGGAAAARPRSRVCAAVSAGSGDVAEPSIAAGGGGAAGAGRGGRPAWPGAGSRVRLSAG